MTEPTNELCLVCDEELMPESPSVIQVDDLNWHKSCLDYIPQRDKWDSIDRETGHAMRKRWPDPVDMSVLLRASPGYYDNREGPNDG